MATNLKSNLRFTLTRFWGGEERGVCLQITDPDAKVCTESAFGLRWDHIALTRREARDLSDFLAAFAERPMNMDPE